MSDKINKNENNICSFLKSMNYGKEPYYIVDESKIIDGVNYNQHNPAPMKLNPKWTKENGCPLFSDFDDLSLGDLEKTVKFDFPPRFKNE